VTVVVLIATAEGLRGNLSRWMIEGVAWAFAALSGRGRGHRARRGAAIDGPDDALDGAALDGMPT
jgi:hypothetical protein